MKREVMMTGRDVDEAVELACRELNVSSEKVKVEIIENSKKSFFGLKTTPARVKVVFEPTKEDIALDYIKDILSAMDIDAKISCDTTDNGLLINLEGDDLGVIIGRRGETLDAIQYLVSLAANRLDGDYLRITIDSGNFREKREETLKNLAVKIAKQAIKTGRNVTLEPMNPYERRIIHAAIQDIDGATSTSKGEEPNRCVVVSSTNPRRNNDRRNNKGYQRKNGSFNKNKRRREFDDENKSYNVKDDIKDNNSSTEIDAKATESPLYSKIEI